MEPNLLIVEDDESMRLTLQELFQEEGNTVVCAESGEEAMAEFDRNQPDLVLMDIRLPGMDGLQVLRKMKEAVPDLLVIIMTAYPQVQTAIRAMKSGAYDYINKPFELDEMRMVVRKALETQDLKNEIRTLRKEREGSFPKTKILGRSRVTQELREIIRVVAGTPRTPVLLTGESGTGKELAANAIHFQSRRAKRPLIKINCSALPDHLLEDELFGHERGAFTDAREAKKGIFEMADGGTLFLDEIGEMSPALQPKLLRVLEGEPFRRVGGTREIRTDVRIIAATNRDLEAMVSRKEFRQDLYYRLKVMEIRLPTLKERKEDIRILVDHFVKLNCHEMGKPPMKITDQALQMLLNYSWAGNVRELKNVIERGVILADGKPIGREHLPLELCKSAAREALQRQVSFPMDLTLEDFEREYILHTLDKVNGNKSAAAKRLGISRSTLIERLKRYSSNSS